MRAITFGKVGQSGRSGDVEESPGREPNNTNKHNHSTETSPLDSHSLLHYPITQHHTQFPPSPSLFDDLSSPAPLSD